MGPTELSSLNSRQIVQKRLLFRPLFHTMCPTLATKLESFRPTVNGKENGEGDGMDLGKGSSRERRTTSMMNVCERGKRRAREMPQFSSIETFHNDLLWGPYSCLGRTHKNRENIQKNEVEDDDKAFSELEVRRKWGAMMVQCTIRHFVSA